ncbi:MAG: hypothetical protein GY730_01965 [bacterium]|nr:hypothetical protein [bacterium]
MKIVGLGYDGFHDSCIALMNERGEVIEAFSEERLSMVKKDGRFPSNALKNLEIKDDDVLCLSTLDHKNFNESYAKAGLTPQKETLDERSRTFEHIKKLTRKFNKVNYYSHHDCHAASAFYFSGFDDALVVTWDAGNNSEPWNFTVSRGKGNILKRYEQSTNGYPALNYTAITAIMGFTPARHEGKITGLAARGNASSQDLVRLREILSSFNKEGRSIMGAISNWKNVGSAQEVPFIELKKDIIKKIREDIGLSDNDLANAIQKLLEEEVITQIKELKDKYPSKNICLAGGIFANVLLNKRIIELGFENIFIHPAMGDDGLAMGACALYLADKGVTIKPFKTLFFGYEICNEVANKALEESDLDFTKPSDMEDLIAKKLAEGKIIARCVGKMEYGPRALGNRSILCTARDKIINEHLNILLKRSEFMPFAPVCLEEDIDLIFKNIEGRLLSSKFMTIALDCKNFLIKRCPTIVHVDGTARPQIVDDENPDMKKILIKFKELTGEPCFVNTSFNIHESPIVCNERDAVKAFKQSKLDYLVLGDCFAHKKI